MAILWTLKLPLSMTVEEAQAVLIVAWLVYDEQASTFTPVLCNLQAAPWTSRRANVEAFSLVDETGEVSRLQPAFSWSELAEQVELAFSKIDAVPSGPQPQSSALDRQAHTPLTTVPSKDNRPWSRSRTGGLPLRGWAEICAAIKASSGRDKQEMLKRLNEKTDGPIKWCDDTPEADRGELLAWIEDTSARNEAAAERRTSTQRASEELGERDGARAQDHGAHLEKRPNARGKARDTRFNVS